MDEEDRLTTDLEHAEQTIESLQSQLDIANKKLEEIRKYCKEDSEYWGNDSYINGLNEGYKEAINGVLSIIGGE